MANRYAVGASFTWNATVGTKWSATDGGAGGASVPTSADAVFFTANSPSSISISGSRACLTLNTTGWTGSLGSIVASSSITAHGSVTFSATTTTPNFTIVDPTVSWILQFAGTGTFTTNSIALYADVYINTAAITVTLSGDLIMPASVLYLINGTFDAATSNVTADSFFSSYTNTRTLKMGTGTWTFASDVPWTITTATNLTITPGTSTINLNTISANFDGNGKTYYNLYFSGSENVSAITGSNTFHDIRTDAGSTLIFTAATTTTVTSLTMTGTAASPITLESSGAAFNLSSSAAISITHATISDSHAAGGGTFVAANSTDVSGNTGWRFVKTYTSFLNF